MKYITAMLLFALLFVSPVLAKSPYQRCIEAPGANVTACNGLSTEDTALDIERFFPPAQFFKDIPSIINILLPNVVLMAGVIVFLFVIAAGFTMIQGAGSGDAKAVEKSQKALMYVITGFLIIVFAYTIIQVVQYVTKVDILNPTF